MKFITLVSVLATSLIAADKSEGVLKFFSCLGPAGKRPAICDDTAKLAPAQLAVAETSPDDEGDTSNSGESVANIGESLVTVLDTQRGSKSKCFQRKGPKFNRQPVVHFYASRAHSAETSKCGPNVEIELKQTNGKLSVEPKLNKKKIKELLIDRNMFNPKVKTYFMTHGFLANWKANGNSWQCRLKDLILNNGDANVFIVDWSGGWNSMMVVDYMTPVSNRKYVGALVGEFIKTLMELTGQADASQYHLIGHSLGAHICGHAGYYLDGSVGHITALDPAGPCFKADLQTAQTVADDGKLADGSRRLSRQSARSVVALHTDSSRFGLKENCAHYDVYVNGGHKQPDCDLPQDEVPGGGGLFARMSEYWDAKKLLCRHNYAYKLFNQFANLVKPLGGREVSGGKLENNWNKCYLMAHQCSDWYSFKAGECGFCMDGDSRCVFVGVSSASTQLAKVDELIEWDQSSPLLTESDEEDEHFNGEADLDVNQNRPPNSSQQDKMEDYIRGKYFIKAGSVPLNCMFHYQIIVAARRQSSSLPEESGKDYYYLHIPLKLSGKLVDKLDDNLNNRLVQVSHKLRPDSPAYNYLKSEYMDALANQDPSVELDFYTALITFEPIVEVEKCQDDQTDTIGQENKWQICKPLNNIQEARLWASSGTRLDSVVWVGMNYMSGLDYKQRMRGSYLFTRGQNEPVKPRAEIYKSSRGNLAGKEPNRPGSSVSMGKSLAYLMDALDVFEGLDGSVDQDARKESKLDRIGSELLHAINMQATRLG